MYHSTVSEPTHPVTLQWMMDGTSQTLPRQDKSQLNFTTLSGLGQAKTSNSEGASHTSEGKRKTNHNTISIQSTALRSLGGMSHTLIHLSLERTPPLNLETCFPLSRLFAASIHPFPPVNYRRNPARLLKSLSFRANTANRQGTRIPAVLETEFAVTEEQSEPPVRIVALVGEGSLSPLKNATWEEVMLHTAKRLKWVDEGYQMFVFTDNLCQSNDQTKYLQRELSHADILLIVAVSNQESVKWIQPNSRRVPNIICFDSSPDLENKLGGSHVQNETNGTLLRKIIGFALPNKINESREVVKTVSEAWERHNTDDIRFCLLVIINAYIRPVPVLKNLRSKGFSTLNCMVKNCGPQMLNCLLDPNCRKALQCLNNCSPVDQKNNCLELDARIPEKPYVPPMVKFRGEDMCHETAEDLFVGWLGSLDWSWRVVAGQNPAYDQFPCQFQLFYRGKAKGSFWYEPVFQVQTLEGKMVWRRRKYRVKRGKVPGTFYFSVLDNGVVSNEFWTIVDVSDDFSWGLFHYSGAARVAGQSYTGAVLVSPDGAYPNEKERNRVVAALDKCGIKEWELYTVDNCSCQGPPLGIPEGSCLHSTIVVEDEKRKSAIS
ncbi:uncharacterized protein LOC110647583 [Hevea brasiliensis]|uniref:uncharacterized protein LOC110647583 n=1 Tax=Hevea brasiliensis TaxID=3981 RepID=UPI0025FA1F7F|nr:uncharacterized protein LOC110647583 [Hevea brasiliensis]